MPVTIAVGRERTDGERRVALVPETAKKFAALGVDVRMEQDAGLNSNFWTAIMPMRRSQVRKARHTKMPRSSCV